MGLIEFLEIGRGEAVLVAGAGGKSSTLRELAFEAKNRDWPVVLSTTTKVKAEEFSLFPVVWINEDITRTAFNIRNIWARKEIPFVAGEFLSETGKYRGIDPEQLESLHRQLGECSFFVEADGARNLPCKVPREHEPVLGSFANLVVYVVGVEAINKPLDERFFYNAKGAAKILKGKGQSVSETVFLTPEVLSELIVSPEGGKKGVFPGQRFTVFVNKVENNSDRKAAAQLVTFLRKNSIKTITGSLQLEVIYSGDIPETAVLLLAAGKSSRMGKLKQLLPGPQGNFLEVSVTKYLPFGRVIVVLGHQAERIREKSHLQGAEVIINEQYEEGMSTSLKAGYRLVRNTETEGILIAFCDIPHIKPETVNMVLDLAAHNPGKIVIPQYQLQKGHPVYIPRRFFPLIETVRGEEGARRIVKNNREDVLFLSVEDEAVTEDIDSEEMYKYIKTKKGWD